MINKTGRVEMTDGRKTRWVMPNEVQDFQKRGYQTSIDEIRVEVRPRKQKQVEVPETETQQPTISEE
jgi:hypothetical protein